jgi:carbamoyl-phosphate synthase large subunit
MLDKLNIPQPPNGLATNAAEALVLAKRLTYPVLVRPSFVLGGRAMQIVYSDAELSHYMRFAVEASPERPVLVDKFLEDATEVDVDCITDVGHFENPAEGTIVIGGMLEHIEFAGVHSGDAAMVLPPHTLSKKVIATIREYTHAMARELKVIGLMNVQYAVKGEKVYVLEVNPRASRTVPFVSKAIGVPLAKLAAKVMAGKTLKELGFTERSGRNIGRSRNPFFPSTAFTARTYSSRPKCGPPVKSWAWTPTSASPTPNPRWPPIRRCPPVARSSSASATRTKRKSPRSPNNSPTWASNSSPPAAPPPCWKKPA